MDSKKTIRVAMYMRVSTVEQTGGFGFDMQEKDLREHVVRNGYKGWVTKDIWTYKEQATGSNTERKELKRLLKAVRNKEVDMVIVWKIDRISRSLSDLLEIFKILEENGVGFASYKEDIDFTGAIGRLIFQIFGALGEFERETIKMRTEEGKKMSAMAGNYIGGAIPYGYKKIPNKEGKGGKLRLIKKEGGIVKQIFRWFTQEGKTTTEIAKELNNLRIPKGESQRSSHKHIKWLAGRIKTFLTNDIYRGSYIANRYEIVSKKPLRHKERPREEWIINKVDAVVSESMFFEAQDRLQNGRKGQRGGGQEIYMLRGKLRDLKTGKGFIGYKSGKGTKNYRRKKCKNPTTGEVYKSMSIASKDLENFVWDYVAKAVNKPRTFLRIHKEKSENFKKQEGLENEYRIYEEALTKANERIERVKNEFYDGEITRKEKGELLLKYEQQREDAFKKLQETEKQITILSRYENGCRDLRAFSENMKKGIKNLSYEQKKNIVQMLVEKVEIEETSTKRKAKVYFRFAQSAITSSIPVGRTDIVENKANKAIPIEGKEAFGGR